MKGRFDAQYKDCAIDLEGNVVISFIVRSDKYAARQCAKDMYMERQKKPDKLVRVTLSNAVKPRSLSANAYFHVLASHIGERLNLGLDAVKKRLVLDYGALLKDENGGTVGIKLPCSVNVDEIYPYAKWFDTRVDNGVRFNCFMLFKRTHTLDSAEMSRLIRGTVAEAKELGIQTETPEELNRILGAWTPSKEE